MPLKRKTEYKSIDKLDQKLIQKASAALLQYVRQKGYNPEKERIYLQINTFHPPENESLRRPDKIFLPNRVLHAEDACLFVKGSQQQLQDEVQKQGLDEIITKVVSIARLKLKYKTVKEKCQLRDSHRFFLMDKRAAKDVTALMGTVLAQKKIKTFPISVDQKKDTIRHQVARCLHSTYFQLSAGTSHSILCGLASQSSEQLLQNIEAILRALLGKYIPRGWNAIDNIAIKTADSVSLPIWKSEQAAAEYKRSVVHIQDSRPPTKKELRAMQRGTQVPNKPL
ncbi:U3 snoRNP-associated protein Cic1/Utp30 family protein [Schizosaccharomyces cryophilus OY26]|uniref:U3 snoRNP-associated protein Cic1/Utp30 family protein n=1 Tax=Schizosaccharomyces cryophilus (strain OY26 / ATCC MYA-4695 / CBS 11777 / NBRC 106824 / NRRL Y48691) TaxID=653667 RepID=S9VUX9_SCHCR|nr:U3 snoRNP-associated protein Cic1/Utp30 family protein [Schizosaccharomyces cryophilus OY26]EPY49989.1 U3 snoRNP-associated protein Cic1/Utp30 family protein [Schizosaccharomyces cryophilus OY26]